MINRMLLKVFLSLFIFPFALAHADSHKSFKLGAVLALTGPLSIVGVPMKNAMLMAKEDFDRDNLIELQFEDDGFVPRNTVAAVQKLITQDRVDALAVFGTNQGLAVAGIVENNKIPFISLNVNRSVAKDKKFVVMAMPSLESLTAVNVSEAKRRGYKKVAIVASIQDSCLLQQEIFQKSHVAEIVSSQQVDPAERALLPIAARVMQSSPDAVFISMLAPQGSLLAKKLREQGFRGELFGGLQTSSLAELKASEGALVNAWVVSGDDRSAARFYQRYRERFHEEPIDLSIYAYDSIKLVLEGIKAKNLNDYLHTLKDFSGIAGTYSADGNSGFTFKVAAKQFTEHGYTFLTN